MKHILCFYFVLMVNPHLKALAMTGKQITFRIVTTVWGERVPLNDERAEKLFAMAEARYNKKREMGQAVGSVGMKLFEDVST